MNCWKTIRVNRDYGTLRLMMYSGCTMLFSFLFYYLIVSILIPTPELTNIRLSIFVFSILTLILVHKGLHLIPIWLCGKKASFNVQWVLLFPILTLKTSKPLSRNLYLIALLTPVLVITTIGALASTMFPMYIAMISILTSIHFGLAFYDIVYASYLVKAPKHSFVENHGESFHILIKQVM